MMWLTYKLVLHCRNNTNGTIALQVNGIYLPNLSESAIVTIATREDSQFEFTIKVTVVSVE